MSTKSFIRNEARNHFGASFAFLDLGRKTLDVMFEWQRQMLDFAEQQNNHFLEAQRRMLELTLEQSRAAARAVRSQSDSQTGMIAGMMRYFTDEIARTQHEWLDFGSRQAGFAAMRGAQAPADWSAMERDWEQFAGRLRDRWDRLTDADLEAARHSRDALIESLQRHYEMAREEVEKQLNDLMRPGRSVGEAA